MEAPEKICNLCEYNDDTKMMIFGRHCQHRKPDNLRYCKKCKAHIEKCLDKRDSPEFRSHNLIPEQEQIRGDNIRKAWLSQVPIL
jgi:hypothetical protein